MPKIKFAGTVFSGTGQGKKFMELPWVKQQLTKKLGFSPYAGTLNIRLNKESAKQKSQLEKQHGIIVYPEESYYAGLLFKAKIGTDECFIVIPQVPNYPKDVLEVIAPINLREKLNLKDGDQATVEVTV